MFVSKQHFVTYLTVFKDGEVCISILHEPGEDKYGYEKPSERWLPIHTVETILISVISMLADPNDESPANVDAAVSNEQSISLLIGRWKLNYFYSTLLFLNCGRINGFSYHFLDLKCFLTRLRHCGSARVTVNK